MARLPRFVLPGHPQHVIIRGNNQEPVFYTDDDYLFYWEKLKQACDKHRCDLHAYVLMTNHIHLLITPHTDNGLSKAIQMLGRYYVQYFNATYQRTGTLWEGRYKATLIDGQAYALDCYRYIELNPLRAQGMVNHPSEYLWSSYRHNALGETDEAVVHHRSYKALGRNNEQRRKAYRALFRARIPQKTLDEIREATNKAWVLGSERFKNRINSQLKRPASPRPRGGDRKSAEYRKQAKIHQS